jgi:hypothetical protein
MKFDNTEFATVEDAYAYLQGYSPRLVEHLPLSDFRHCLIEWGYCETAQISWGQRLRFKIRYLPNWINRETDPPFFNLCLEVKALLSHVLKNGATLAQVEAACRDITRGYEWGELLKLTEGEKYEIAQY